MCTCYWSVTFILNWIGKVVFVVFHFFCLFIHKEPGFPLQKLNYDDVTILINCEKEINDLTSHHVLT